jgi:hypothetical protein
VVDSPLHAANASAHSSMSMRERKFDMPVLYRTIGVCCAGHSSYRANAIICDKNSPSL